MKKTKDLYVVGIGAANADIYGKSNIKIKSHYDHPSIIKTTVGGVTRNILANISKLGIKTKLLTAVGDDIYADLIINEAEKANIGTKDVIKVKGERSGIFIQVQDKNNDMHLALCDMTITHNINEKYIKSKDKVLKNASLIILDPSLDNKVIKYILQTYKNIPTFVDPISDNYALKIKPFLKDIYCIKPNRTELENLSGIQIKNKEDLYKAYRKVSRKVKKLYVTLGKDGCLYKDVNDNLVIRKFNKVDNMINASGAGDSFFGALAYSYINNYCEEDTIDLALAAGIASILSEKTINPKMGVKYLRKIVKENK